MVKRWFRQTKKYNKGVVKLTDKIILCHILFVPKLNCNLISVSQLNDDLKFLTQFDFDLCAIQDRHSREVIGTGWTLLLTTRIEGASCFD